MTRSSRAAGRGPAYVLALGIAAACALARCASGDASASAPNLDCRDAAEDSGAADAREPSREPHRQSARACEPTRPCNEVAPGPACSSHEDCAGGDNGRCQRFGLRCTYDECTRDTDCPPGNLCDCAGGSDGQHRCLQAGCRTDADCAGRHCSPSPDFSCADRSQIVGYYCHGPDDECQADADCAGYCAYDPASTRFRCIDVGCLTR
jgi:hypothetical protein